MEFFNEAKKLQQLSKRKPGQQDARLICITSGKGGVGKSNFILNMAIAMSIRNKKVLLIDADMNLSNLDILLGIYPQYSVRNLLDDVVDIEKILVEGPKGIKILPASSGDINVARNAKLIQQTLIQAFNELRPKFDYILIDTGAGVSEYTMDFVYSSDKVIVISTPEPTSITDAYAMIKMLFYHSRNPDISVVINMTQSEKEGQVIYDKISQILSHFLNKQVRFLGSIMVDKNLPDAVKDQTPVILKHPRASSSAAIHNIAVQILKEDKRE